MMRASMAAFMHRFSSRRMLHDYAAKLYELPGYETATPAAPTGAPQRSTAG
jgi:hypothetical protein